jgi:pimeloyl-ACP methyl ester carboxylesterase
MAAQAILAAMPSVTEETFELDGQPVHLRRAGTDDVPILFLHGIPTSSFDWLAPLALGGGIAVDLPGFGRTGKRGDLDYSLEGHATFIDRLLETLGIDRVRLCAHDWGAAAGLVWAMRDPARVERIVIVNGVPLLPGFRWHGAARLARAPFIGEIAVGLGTRRVMRLLSRRASGHNGPLPDAFVKSAAEHFDQGTQRAVLRILRDTTPEVLAAAGQDLSTLTAPALVLWGAEDPLIPARFGAGYAATLGDGTLESVADAGHWPWIDQPQLSERIVEYLRG